MSAQPIETPDGPTSPWVEDGCCICDARTTILHRSNSGAEWLPFCDADLPLGGEARIYSAPVPVSWDGPPIGDGRFLTAAERDRIDRTGTIR